jgi:MFS family permease
MDTWGRKFVALPSLFALALGLAILPLTHDLYSFLVVAVLTGLGNGLGAGIVMTLGADFAPDDRRGEFLGVWRLIGDGGQAGGPILISLLVGLASLSVAALVCSGIGMLGGIVMAVFLPETLSRAHFLDPTETGFVAAEDAAARAHVEVVEP